MPRARLELASIIDVVAAPSIALWDRLGAVPKVRILRGGFSVQ